MRSLSLVTIKAKMNKIIFDKVYGHLDLADVERDISECWSEVPDLPDDNPGEFRITIEYIPNED